MNVAMPKPAQPGQYEVVAVLQDNRENTLKVGAVVANSFDALDAVLEEAMGREVAMGHARELAEQIVKETYSVLYLSTRFIEE